MKRRAFLTTIGSLLGAAGTPLPAAAKILGGLTSIWPEGVRVMAGTEGTYKYVVLAANAAGRIGMRPLSNGRARIRLEPAPDAPVDMVETLAKAIPGADWTRPGHGGQNRWSTVVDLAQCRNPLTLGKIAMQHADIFGRLITFEPPPGLFGTKTPTGESLPDFDFNFDIDSMLENVTGKIDAMLGQVDAAVAKIKSLPEQLGSAIGNIEGAMTKLGNTPSEFVSSMLGRLDNMTGRFEAVLDKVDGAPEVARAQILHRIEAAAVQITAKTDQIEQLVGQLGDVENSAREALFQQIDIVTAEITDITDSVEEAVTAIETAPQVTTDVVTTEVRGAQGDLVRVASVADGGAEKIGGAVGALRSLARRANS